MCASPRIGINKSTADINHGCTDPSTANQETTNPYQFSTPPARYAQAKRAREILAKRLKELRAEKGWPQDERAAQAGQHWAWIGAIERAERDMRIDNLDKLAAACRIPVKELFESQPHGAERRGLQVIDDPASERWPSQTDLPPQPTFPRSLHLSHHRDTLRKD